MDNIKFDNPRRPGRHAAGDREYGPFCSSADGLSLGRTEAQLPFSGTAFLANLSNPDMNDIKLNFLDISEDLSKNHYYFSHKKHQGFAEEDIIDISDVLNFFKNILDEGDVHGNCLSVCRGIIAENLENVTFNNNQDVIYPVSNPIYLTRGFVGLIGLLVSERITVNSTDIDSPLFQGFARCFNSPAEACIAIKENGVEEGDAIIIRCESSKETYGCFTALIEDGDLISINTVAGELTLNVSAEDQSKRKVKWGRSTYDYQSGTLWKYAKQVEATRSGAMTHPEGREEVVCYADI